MADVVTTQILENGPRRIVTKFTNFSDGTGESGVTKVDATSAGPYGVVIAGQTYYPGTHLKVVGIIYDLKVMSLRIQWVATSNVDMLVLGGFGQWRFTDMRAGFQGLINPLTTGATGSISFTTEAAAANASYSVILEMIKGIPQS